LKDLWLAPEGKVKADIAPMMVGNAGAKELILAALCVFNIQNIKETVVPFVIVAKSGAGKTTLLRGIKKSFGQDCDIFNINALTGVQMKGTVKGGKLVKAELRPISLFDETNKWQQNYLEEVIMPVFGGEVGVRWREGEKIEQKEFRTLPVGTLLPHWEDFEGKGGHAAKRIHNIEQIMRRSVILRLDEGYGMDDKFLDDYTDMLAGRYFANISYTSLVDLETNYRRLIFVINMAHDLPDQEIAVGAWEKVKPQIKRLARMIVISDRVSYHGSLTEHIFRLGIGLSRRYGRFITYQDDFERVMSLLEENARINGMLRELCPTCNLPNLPGNVRCTSCGDPMKVKETGKKDVSPKGKEAVDEAPTPSEPTSQLAALCAQQNSDSLGRSPPDLSKK